MITSMVCLDGLQAQSPFLLKKHGSMTVVDKSSLLRCRSVNFNVVWTDEFNVESGFNNTVIGNQTTVQQEGEHSTVGGWAFTEFGHPAVTELTTNSSRLETMSTIQSTTGSKYR